MNPQALHSALTAALINRHGTIRDPGNGGTLDVANKHLGYAELGTAGTVALPTPPRAGFVFFARFTATITVTGVGSFVSGNVAIILADSASSWSGIALAASGAAGGAAGVAIVDGGGFTGEATVEGALQEIYRRSVPSTTTAITTAGAGVLTAAGLVGGIITRSGPTAAYTDTTATATQIRAAYAFGEDVNASRLVFIRNTVAFAETIAAGTDINLSGISIVPPNSVGIFLLKVDGADSMALIGLGSFGQATQPNGKFTTIATDTTITAAAGALTGARHVSYATTAAGAGGIALTTRTATEMFADIPNCYIGFTWRVRIISDGGGVVTLTAGTGVTITGTATVASNVWKEFLCTFTSATALTMQNIGSGTVDAT